MSHVDDAVPLECTLECALQTESTHSDAQLILRAPASLLLCGEYFVTEVQGQGLCLAVEPSATCTITWHRKKNYERNANAHTQDTLRLITRFAHGEHVQMRACENEMYMLCDACKEPYLRMYQSHAMPAAEAITITVDTNAFYTEAYKDKKDVQKRGLGSSESAALLMCAALALCTGKDPLTNRRALASHASHVHYLWQGGRGSGYGAWTSAFGGMGIYTNYAEKTRATNRTTDIDTSEVALFAQNMWHMMPREVFSSLYWWFWNCGHAQSSKGALMHYNAWKREKPHEGKKFVAQYTQLFRTLECDVLKSQKDAQCAAFVVQAIEQAKVLGLWLGTQIRVCAEIENCKSMENAHAMCAYKAVGAGCECAIGVSYDDELRNDISCDIQKLPVTRGIGYVAPRYRF